MNPDLLVPLDGSKAAENALPVAIAVSSAFDLPIRFLEAVDTAQHGPTGHPDPARSEEMFRGYIEELAGRYELDRARWHAASIAGSPADVIVAAAEQAAMVALATHGHGGLRAAVIGSVADRVIRRTPVPVFVVPAVGPAPALGPGPILVALDGSDESARALPIARDAAARLHRELILIQSYSPMIPPATAETGYCPPNYLDDLDAGVQASLAAVAAAGEKIRALCGPTVDVIATTAESVDACLLVLASSGKGVAKRLTIGSTTNSLLHGYHRPMLIIPRAT